jgi:seryl-tRNA synthetase
MWNSEITEAMERLHRELNELAPAIEHVRLATEVTTQVSEIPKRHLDLIKDVEASQNAFSDKLTEIVKDETSEVLKENKSILDQIGNSNKEINEFTLALKSNVDAIDAYLNKINSIDFPARLSSIEADISSISSALNNLQFSINNLQSEYVRYNDENRNRQENLKDQLTSFSEKQAASIQELMNRNTMTRNIIIAFGILTVVVSLVSIFK